MKTGFELFLGGGQVAQVGVLKVPVGGCRVRSRGRRCLFREDAALSFLKLEEAGSLRLCLALGC